MIKSFPRAMRDDKKSFFIYMCIELILVYILKRKNFESLLEPRRFLLKVAKVIYRDCW